MATQSVPFDINEAHEALAKARGIVEILGKALMHEMSYEAGSRYSDSLWAVSDQLDKLAAMTGLDPQESVEVAS